MAQCPDGNLSRVTNSLSEISTETETRTCSSSTAVTGPYRTWACCAQTGPDYRWSSVMTQTCPVGRCVRVTSSLSATLTVTRKLTCSCSTEAPGQFRISAC